MVNFLPLLITIKGRTKSFHLQVKENMESEAIKGLERGNTILEKICHSPAPSTLALSKNSFGIPSYIE